MNRECPECGNEYDGAKGLSTHMRHQHENRPWIPKDDLFRLYHIEGYSQHEIADIYDVNQAAIWRAMDKWGLETDKSRSDPTHPPKHGIINPSKRVGSEYEQIQTTIDDQCYSFLVHRMIAVAHGKLPVREFTNGDKVVHHESKHGLDNRPPNLEVMDRGDHQTMHNIERYS